MNPDLHIDHLLDEYTTGAISRDWLQKQLPELNATQLEEEISLHRAATVFLERAPLLAQVGALHEQFLSENKSIRAERRTHFQNRFKWISIAASVLLLAGIYFWQIQSVSDSNTLYAELYQPYQVPVFRSSESTNTITKLYQEKQYRKLVSVYEQQQPADNSAHFYAGLSYLQEAEWKPAAIAFQRILDNGEQPLFRDEAQFYGALAYLKAGEPEKALALFEVIEQDPQHLYHPKIGADQVAELRALLRK